MRLGKRLVTLLLIGVSLTAVGCGKDSMEYKDGVYRAESVDFDKQGWKVFMELTFKDGDVTDVNFDYISQEDGRLKTQDDFYNNLMLNKVGVNPKIFAKELAVEVLAKQSPEDIDGIAGATVSCKEASQLAEVIFENARKGDTSTYKLTLK